MISWQKEIFQKSDIEPVFVNNENQIQDKNEHVVVGDNVYFTEELFIEFLTKSRQQKSNTICSLKKGLTTLRTMSSIQDVKYNEDFINYNLHYLSDGKFRGKDYYSLVINSDQSSDHLMVPEHICNGEKYQIPLTTKLIIQIDHWANLWVSNVLTALLLPARLKLGSKSKLLLIALRARSINQWKVLSFANKIGKGCDIHPTAYIEGSIIGNGVKIAAGAVVRESIVGNHVSIGNSVTIENSVIGGKSTILHGHVMFSCIYPGVFSVSQMISASFVGKDSFLASGSVLNDFRLDGNNVKLIKDGIKFDSGSTFLGCCLGNNVYLGSGCIVAPGRAVSSGLHIALKKDRVIAEGNHEMITRDFRLVNY